MIIKLVHDNQLFVDDRCNLAFAKKAKPKIICTIKIIIQ